MPVISLLVASVASIFKGKVLCFHGSSRTFKDPSAQIGFTLRENGWFLKRTR